MWLCLPSADGLAACLALVSLFALQDVMTQLGNFYSSLLSIPNHPWSSEVSPTSVTSQAPLDVYVWYHNMYTSVRPPHLLNLVACPI